MGHKESKIFHKVEEAIANQDESNHKSLEKNVLQLWKTFDKNHQEYLGPEEANEFFGKIYDYCKTTLRHEGIVFDPSLSREDLIESWKKKFDLDHNGKITYEGFCLALKATSSACHKELREREEKELAESNSPAVSRSNSQQIHGHAGKTVPHSKAEEDVLQEENKLLEEVQREKTSGKKEKKEKKKDKEKEDDSHTPSTLRRVFAHNENPILMQTFEFKFYCPKDIEHFSTASWSGTRADVTLNKLRLCVPLEYPKLGVNVIIDGVPGAGLSTIMEKYCEAKETLTDDHPLAMAECTRDLYNIGLYIPVKIYKYAPREKPTDPYIKFSSGLLVKVDLWVFVLDVTKELSEDLLALIQHRIRLVSDFFKQMKLNPALLFVGSKLDERDVREYSFEDGKKLAEKYGAMYTEMSGATGMFVVRGWNAALRAAIGHKEQKLLFANVQHMT